MYTYTFLYSCSRYEYEHLKDLKEKKERKTIPNWSTNEMQNARGYEW